jgi:hypothetical protein
VEHLACIREMKFPYKGCDGESREESPVWSSKFRWKDNIDMDLV